jgi:flavin reductase (DIM6/NTAB) family NADH-FMN oxidoreductase RutF
MTTDDPIKTALRMMPYGFYSLTTHNDDTDNAMVVNWVTQASFDPRQIAVALSHTAFSYGLVKATGVFALNIFNKADAEIIKQFTKSREKNPDKMAEAEYTPGPETGCPILTGAAAYLECRVAQMFNAGGDHDVVVADIVNAAVMKPGEVTDTLSLPDIGWSYAG